LNFEKTEQAKKVSKTKRHRGHHDDGLAMTETAADKDNENVKWLLQNKEELHSQQQKTTTSTTTGPE
jgi:hypothetical protein